MPNEREVWWPRGRLTGVRCQGTLGSNSAADKKTFQYFNNVSGHRQNVSLAVAKYRDWMIHPILLLRPLSPWV